MAGFFNPFRAPVSRTRQTRRCPRYALESLEARLSPSDLGLTTVDVSTISTTTTMSDMDMILAAQDPSALTQDFSTSSSDPEADMELMSQELASNADSPDDTELPDGDGTPPYTPSDSDGGPAGPA
ncbi:MAG TPA: hypothetical protein VFT74_01220 [Isosphaeraceae bacterium]|nr:hypothetical protein [Isosphaeraceae bacterium]